MRENSRRRQSIKGGLKKIICHRAADEGVREGVEGRGSRVEGRGSRVEGRGSEIGERGSGVWGRRILCDYRKLTAN